jgi:hypothetical protein
MATIGGHVPEFRAAGRGATADQGGGLAGRDLLAGPHVAPGAAEDAAPAKHPPTMGATLLIPNGSTEATRFI